MAQGDIYELNHLGTFSTRRDPFLTKDTLPYSTGAFQYGTIDVSTFKSLNTNKQQFNKILSFWEPQREKADFKFPYKNIFELIQHSGTQSGYLDGDVFLPIGERDTFATSGDMINAGYDPDLATRFGYKYTASGAKIGYNEIYIEGNATLNDLIGKDVNCIMISRFSSTGIVTGATGDLKQKKQKTITPYGSRFFRSDTSTGAGFWSGFKNSSPIDPPGFVRYKFFLTTGSITSGNNTDPDRKSLLSIGSKCNFINYVQIAKNNNANYSLSHSGISGQELYGQFFIANTGNSPCGYKMQSLDNRIIIDNYCLLSGNVKAGDMFAFNRKNNRIKRSIDYKVETTGLEIDKEYTGYIQLSGIYGNNVQYNITGLNLPIYYKIYNYEPKVYFDNFYFKFNGPGVNDFESYPINTPIDCSGTGIYPWKSGAYITGYPKVKLGLTIYNTGSGVSGAYSLNKIDSGWFNPSLESQLYWDATGSDYIWTNTRWGGVKFATGESGSLPSKHYIPFSGTSGAFCNDIYFSISNTGQFPAGLFSGDLCVKTSDPINQKIFFPILINYL